MKTLDIQTISIIWLLICTALVLLMQAGFTCLESGFTRSKNSINVAMKNVVDFGISVTVFWFFGYALMFGVTKSGMIGTSHFMPIFNNAPWFSAFFLFQGMFCGTATTIVSGGVAERMRFTSYLIISLFISGVLYPIFGHWAWNGIDKVNPTGFLGKMGFIDIAGSTVVHSLAGWATLATLMVVGSREGRFPENEAPRKISGSNIPLSALGAFILLFGWIGFNGGSVLFNPDRIPAAIINTILAGAAGTVATFSVDWFIFRKDKPSVVSIINGPLAGVVAITATCSIVLPGEAILIGAIGGVAMLLTDRLLERFKIDDAVGAVPVHLGAGIWGTLAVGIFGDLQLIGGSNFDRLNQLGIQFFGILLCFIWSFGLTYIFLRLINGKMPLRVDAESERIGLNVSEHGATTELFTLYSEMETQANSGDLSFRLTVQPFTEIGQIAGRYNNVMESLQLSNDRLKSVMSNAPIVLWQIDREGVIEVLDGKALETLGIVKEELMGKSIYDAYGENPELVQFVDKALEGKQSETVLELEGYFLDVKCNCIYGNDEVIGLIGVLTDITDYRKTLVALNNSEARLSAILDIADDAIISIDGNHKIVMFNQGATRIFGYSIGEVLGESVNLLLPQNYRHRHSEHINDFGSSEETPTRSMGERGMISGRRKDGTIFPAEASISRLEMDGEKLFTVTLRDITERVRSIEALRASESRFREIFKYVPDALLHVSDEMEIVESNLAFNALLDEYAPKLSIDREELRHQILVQLQAGIGRGETFGRVKIEGNSAEVSETDES